MASERRAARGRAGASDPLLQAFMNAPDDDEPLTPEDIAAIKEAADDFARGYTVSWEAYRAGRRSGVQCTIKAL